MGRSLGTRHEDNASPRRTVDFTRRSGALPDTDATLAQRKRSAAGSSDCYRVALSRARTSQPRGTRRKAACSTLGKPEHPKHRRGVQIDIGAKMLFAVHHFFEFFANWNPLFLARAFAQVAPDLTHHRHT